MGTEKDPQMETHIWEHASSDDAAKYLGQAYFEKNSQLWLFQKLTEINQETQCTKTFYKIR